MWKLYINEKDQIYRKTENTDGLSSNYLNPNVRKTFSNTKWDIGSKQQHNLTSTPSLLKTKIVLPHHATISRTSSTAETEVYPEESNPKGGTRLNAPLNRKQYKARRSESRLTPPVRRGDKTQPSPTTKIYLFRADTSTCPNIVHQTTMLLERIWYTQ